MHDGNSNAVIADGPVSATKLSILTVSTIFRVGYRNVLKTTRVNEEETEDES